MAKQDGGQSRQLVTMQKKAETVRDLLVARKAELAAALPRHLSADRMVRLALTACVKNPKLLDCTPSSLYGAVLQASQLGLEIDLLGQAYIVPFWNSKRNVFEVQFMPGYQGLLALARRSGEIAKIDAHCVYEGDRFTYSYGLKPTLEHEPSERSANLTHAYAIAWLKVMPEPVWRVMSRKEIDEKHRARSRAAAAGPWVTDYDAMALKTVLRALCKLLPASVELQTAVVLDEAAEVGLPQDLGRPMLVGLEESPAAAPPPAADAADDPAAAEQARADWEAPGGAQREPGEEG